MFMIRRIRLTSSADVEAEDPRRPRRRQEERRQDLDERRLAGAVGPEQPEELAGRDVEVDAVEGDDRRRLDVVDAANAARLDGGRAGRDGHTGPREGTVWKDRKDTTAVARGRGRREPQPVVGERLDAR